jgi:2-keto-4-pentenoate hydratase/2-oxohepta-3-ene-1,7-dioic acid hydratase in catechol pathway
MIYSVPFLVRWISRMMTLEPGDLIATGTPSGVGPLVPGDTVEVAVEGIGVLSNPVHPPQA